MLEIQTQLANRAARLVLVGAIDEPGAEAMKQAFLAVDVRQLSQLSLDFGRVTHIGSSGLGKLLLFYKRLTVANVTLVVENCPPPIAAMLRELRIDSLFQVR